MKFRTPTFPLAPRDPNDEAFNPMPLKTATMPALREKKSLRNLWSSGAEAERDNTAQTATGARAMLRRKFSRPNLNTSTVSPIEKSEDVPPLPPTPTAASFLRRKFSRPNLKLDTSDANESLPPVPAIPSSTLKRSPSTFSFEEGSIDAKGDASQSSRKQALRELLGLRGNGTVKLVHKKSRPQMVEPKTLVPLTAGASPLDRRSPTSQADSQTAKPMITKRKSLPNTRRMSDQAGAKAARRAPSPAELAKKLLTVEQIRAMSVGAPCFSVEECNGRYKPQVMFRGSNAETSADFLRDYHVPAHPSFRTCTLGMEERKEDTADIDNEDGDEQKATADLMEMPSMLCAQGLDPGTVGFEHFLQLPIADDVVRMDDSDVDGKRRLLTSAPAELGLRPLNIEVLVYRLTELGQLLTTSRDQSAASSVAWNATKLEEMGTELFGKLLAPESANGSRRLDMHTQIRALQKVLRTSALWRDFGFVEWRTRIGELLWAAESAETIDAEDGGPSERDVLLLQLTLASELLIRLNVVRLMANRYTPILSPMEAMRLQSQRTTKINWDLLLAERFLDNIDISCKLSKEANRSSLMRAIPFLSALSESNDDASPPQPILIPRNGDLQLEGLRHFAEALQWPHSEFLPTQLDKESHYSDGNESPLSSVLSHYATPLQTPRLSHTPMRRHSVLDLMVTDADEPALSKTSTTEPTQLTRYSGSIQDIINFEGCGWLSKSWLSGLVIPGATAGHLLISTLLESSPQALSILGADANFFGGFQYQARSYWSKSCIVGRVLAAKQGAAECMEWVSIPAVSEEQQDGWIDLAVQQMPETRHKPRITSPEAVAWDSDLLHNRGLLASARVGDFTWPSDSPPTLGNDVKYEGLKFNKSSDGNGNGAEKTQAIASLAFSSKIQGKHTVVEIPLIFDARFISSYPCHPRTVRHAALPRLPQPLTIAPPLPQTALPPPQTSPPPPPVPSKSPVIAAFPLPPNNDSNKENRRPGTSPKQPGENFPPAQKRPQTASGASSTDSGYASKQNSASTILSFRDLAPPTINTPCHPLHTAYNYDIVPASTLFTTAMHTRPRAPTKAGAKATSPDGSLSNGSVGSRPPSASSEKEKEVMILDCRGGEDLELFARAWCAQVGENAIIGKAGRTCLACCVREARGLGVCVVIRV